MSIVHVIVFNEKLIVLVHCPDSAGHIQEWGSLVCVMPVRRRVLALLAGANVTHTESHVCDEIGRYETFFAVSDEKAQKIAQLVDWRYCG